MTDSPTEGQGNLSGIYSHEGKGYEVKTLTVLRFQRLLPVLAITPVDKVLNLILPEDGEAEVNIADILEAVFSVMGKAQDLNIIVNLVSIALDIDSAEAGELPIEIGGPAIVELFTSNLELLRTFRSFSEIESELKGSGAAQPTKTRATRKSSDDSQTSSTDTIQGKK